MRLVLASQFHERWHEDNCKMTKTQSAHMSVKYGKGDRYKYYENKKQNGVSKQNMERGNTGRDNDQHVLKGGKLVNTTASLYVQLVVSGSSHHSTTP